ncbi:MAG TPA: flippase-like domain-containing protein [Chloroflexi bacterium]|nr:flippase-like domain-containing protein [Chloroflexota bacterium]
MMTEKQDTRFPYRVIPGILISLGALILLISLSDSAIVLEALNNVRLQVLVPAGVLVIVSLFTRAFAWRGILQERITLWQSYLIINAGYFINTVLPFRLGEISRAFLLMPSGFGFWEALPSIILERLIDVGFALSLLFIGLPSALGFTNDLVYVYILTGLLALGAISLYLGIKNRERILAWVEGIPLRNEKIKGRVVRFVKSVISSLEILTHPRRLLQVLAGMAASWGIALLFQYLLLRVFVPDARLAWAAFALGAVAVGVSVPSSPGNIGLYEGSITLALTACGVDPSLAFSYALTSHIINLGITTGFGVYGLVREGVKLRDVWQFSKQQKGEEI